MEFKITKDKIAQCNRAIILFQYSTPALSVLSFYITESSVLMALNFYYKVTEEKVTISGGSRPGANGGGGGGGGGAVLIYLPCRPFSLQSFLFFYPK